MRLDGNNVDIEMEMALMAKNTIRYSVLSQRLSNEFNKIKSVINEGDDVDGVFTSLDVSAGSYSPKAEDGYNISKHC